MDLHTYLSAKRGRQKHLALSIGAHAPDLCRWADGKRCVPVRFAALIERHTDGCVTRKDLFPDTWQKIWPELATEASADAVSP
jgi:DNA-binding transcriptional regulator YdaS (Cro superfamily)